MNVMRVMMVMMVMRVMTVMRIRMMMHDHVRHSRQRLFVYAYASV